MLKEEVAQRLFELRKKAQMSQAEVAEKMGITVAAYQNYETGRREANYENLAKLAKIYGVTTDYLLGQNSEEEWSTLMGKAFGSQEALERFSELKEEAKTVIIAAMVELGRIAQEGNEEPHDKETPK